MGFPIINIRWSQDRLTFITEVPISEKTQGYGVSIVKIWEKTDLTILQWNLYKATTELCGLSRQVVFHSRENKHDFVKTVPGKWQNLCVFSKTSPVSLHRFHWSNITALHKNKHHDTSMKPLLIFQHIVQYHWSREKTAHKISMGQCKKDVTPLLTHWSYVFLALTHRSNPYIPFGKFGNISVKL